MPQRPAGMPESFQFRLNPDQFDRRKAVAIGLVIAAVLLVISGVTSAVYTVQPEGEAVVKRFGRVTQVQQPGLHFKLPFGIDRAYFVPTRRVLKEEFGFRTVESARRASYRKDQQQLGESLMLTGDLKVIDVEWVVQYRIEDAEKYLHRVRNPETTIRDISEAVMRRIVGNNLGSDVLTEKRVAVATLARDELQALLDSFESGIRVSTIELQDVTPPEPVKPAFNEVNQAEQERERVINEAEKRRNQVIPRAEGEAQQMIASAEGYRAERVNRALGETARFNAILEQYRKVPEVTRQRLYLEMIDAVMPRLGRVIITEEGSISPIPLLNLDSAQPAPAPAPAAQRQGASR